MKHDCKDQICNTKFEWLLQHAQCIGVRWSSHKKVADETSKAVLIRTRNIALCIECE